MTPIPNLGTQSQETASLSCESFERSKNSPRNAERPYPTSRKSRIPWLRTKRTDGTKVGNMLFSPVVGVTAVRQKQTRTCTRSVGSQYPLKTFKCRKRKKAKSAKKDRRRFLKILVWCFQLLISLRGSATYRTCRFRHLKSQTRSRMLILLYQTPQLILRPEKFGFLKYAPKHPTTLWVIKICTRRIFQIKIKHSNLRANRTPTTISTLNHNLRLLNTAYWKQKLARTSIYRNNHYSHQGT